MSTLADVSGTSEVRGKGTTPKEYNSCDCISWGYDEESYHCHLDIRW